MKRKGPVHDRPDSDAGGKNPHYSTKLRVFEMETEEPGSCGCVLLAVILVVGFCLSLLAFGAG